MHAEPLSSATRTASEWGELEGVVRGWIEEMARGEAVANAVMVDSADEELPMFQLGQMSN